MSSRSNADLVLAQLKCRPTSVLTSAAIALLISVATTDAGPFDAWDKKMKITFDGYDRSETLTNFPVLVELGAHLSGFSYGDFMSSDHDDLRFADASESVELVYEIDDWDNSGTSYVWVAVDGLTNSGCIYAYWSKSGETSPSYTTNGATWSNDYVGVWHLNEDPSATAPQMDDSSTNGNDITMYSMSSDDRVTGKIGNALDFDNNTAHYGDVDLPGNWDAPCTIHAWGYFSHLNQPNGDYDYLLLAGTNPATMSMSRAAANHTTLTPDAFFTRSENSNREGPVLTGQVWTHLVLVYTSSSPFSTLYVNGVERSIDNNITSALTTDGKLSLGRYINEGNPNHPLNGRVDEMRMSTVARSTNWVWATWLNSASNTDFQTYGTIESPNAASGGPEITTTAESEVTVDSASLNGNLSSTGTSATAVWVFYGETDGTNNPTAWDTNKLVEAAGAATGAKSYAATGLDPYTTYHYRYFATNDSEGVFASSSESFMTLRRLCVDVTAAGDGSGSSWDNASLLTNALIIATDDTEIWIAEGTYTNSSTFTVATNNLTLYGGFTNGMATVAERDWDAYPALLDGQATRRAMLISGSGVTLDGLLITNALHNAVGNGLYAGSTADGLRLLNCTFTHNEPSANHANGGGAALVSCSVFISNCVFDANQSKDQGTIRYQGGGGLYANAADVVIVDCVFTNNGTKDFDSRDGNNGGGILAVNGSLAVTNTAFVNNGFYTKTGSTWGGGGARISGVNPARFYGCLFTSNYTWTTVDRDASGGGLGISGSGAQVTIEHCIFDGNYCVQNDSQGGAICVTAGNVGITNCTFVNNETDDQGGAITVLGGSLTMANSILSGNTADIRGDDVALTGGSGTISYSRLDGLEGTDYAFDESDGLTLSNVFTNDPLFASSTDLHLQSPAGRWNGSTFVTTDPSPFSPGIDAGDPATPVGDEVAANGGRVNIGRYGGTAEASKSTNTSPTVENRHVTTNVNIATMRGELVTTETIAECRIYYSTNMVPTNTDSYASIYPPQQTGTVFTATVNGLLYGQTYYYRCYATNASGEDWANSVSNFTTGAEPPGGGPTILHVDVDAAGGETGENWFNAYTSLKDAAAAITAGTNEIWVAAGTYSDATVEIAGDCTVYGGFDGTETNLSERDPSSNFVHVDGGFVRRGINITDGNVIIDSLIVTNCRINANGCGLNASSGVDDLKLIDCTFTENEASSSHRSGGGAAFASCPVLITNCLFEGNFADTPASIWYQSGGGIYGSAADITIVDCVFTNNGNPSFNSRDRFTGGAMYLVNGSLEMSGTVIADNKFYGRSGTANGGGGCRLNGVNPARIAECLFEGNYIWSTSDRDTSGGAILIEGGSSDVAIEHCTFNSNYCANTDSQGGAICLNGGTLSVTNCTFVNNYTDDQGGLFTSMPGHSC